MSSTAPRLARPGAARIVAAIAGLSGIGLGIGGLDLLRLGGSAYYLLAALALIAGAGLLWRRSPRARPPFHLLLAGTIGWAYWETGGALWGMLGRIGFFAVLWLLVMIVTRRSSTPVIRRSGVVAATALAAAVLLAISFGDRLIPSSAAVSATAPPAAEDQDWADFARTKGASRFSPLGQITPANVGALKPAWVYRTGDMPRASDEGLEFTFEATPIKIADTLYLCTPHNIVIALDAETGKERWRFDPKVQDNGAFLKACRGVSYVKLDKPLAQCSERILSATIDARMIALDARTGHPCPGFGRDGEIPLNTGLGKVTPGFAYVTSAPMVVDTVAIIGGWVLDGQHVGMPSGAIRAFDVTTGAFLWAWDMGRPGDNKLPPEGETFTPGTPNSWAPMSADPALGLVYLPMGNSTPDYWGAHRTRAAEAYASSIVALDVQTGAPRWSYQTVHHDLWDFDIPASPILFTFKRGALSVPALAQVTKLGEIFVLDRRTGKPLIPAPERPVPTGAAAGDWLSPTQPFSQAPSLTPPPLSEKRMWGVTPFDHLWCRIQFQKHRYEGPYTPPGERRTIFHPGPYGAIDWGNATIDEDRGLLIANSNALPFSTRLIPRKEVDAMLASSPFKVNGVPILDPHLGISIQRGTPFAFAAVPMLSPLEIPCNEPPWGLLSAIDLNAARLRWRVPFGTARDSGPFGTTVGLPLKTGVMSMGGPTSTRGGLTFIGAGLDNYIRAYDSQTGKVLWRSRLPAGGQASPMTYWSAASGRQFVVIAAGGHGALKTRLGDYVVAYALPRPE